MMKTLTIAIKDMTRSSRSAFALVFMFVVPLLLTGMIYLMFGKSAAPDANAAASPMMVKVAVANLDRGDPTLAEILANFPGGADLHSLGDVMVQSLQNPALVGMLQVSPAADAASARQ